MTTKSAVKRPRRKRAEIEALLGDYRDSGLGQGAYAAKAGIKLGTLRSLLYRQRGRKSGGFAAVQITAPAAAGPASVVTIRWPQGMEVELPGGMGEASLRPWLRELFRSCLR